MASSYTSLLGFVLPVTGELSGTWGDVWNASGTSLIESAIAGTTTLSTDGDVTLSTTTGAANQSRQAILLCSGARTALRTITAPAQSKIYTVINATTGGFSVKVVGAGPTTGVTIVAGESAQIAWNGSDFVKVSNTGGAASFTDITVSGSATFSGGTANGVAYLNGSKVLTTGSALTFNGTLLEVAAASAGATAEVLRLSNSGAGANTQAQLKFYTTSTNYGTISGGYGSSAPQMTFDLPNGTPGNYVWQISSTEQMRLTSTGLGIGTSSPIAKLSVSGAGLFYRTGSPAYLLGSTEALTVYSAGGQEASMRFWQGGIASALIGHVANDSNLYITNTYAGNALGSTGLVLNSAGNVGVGTPFPGAKLEVGVSGATTSLDGVLVSNGTATGIFQVSGATYSYRGISANNLWVGSNGGNDMYVGPSTANVLKFGTAAFEYMRLDTSGNLGIGTSSPAYRLHVANASGGYIALFSNLANADLAIDCTSGVTTLSPTTGILAFGTNSTERMRLDSSGNLGIGTTTPASYAQLAVIGAGSSKIWGECTTATGLAQIHVRGTSGKQSYFWQASASYSPYNSLVAGNAGVYATTNLSYEVDAVGYQSWWTAGSERMRLDSSGDLLIGTTSAGATGITLGSSRVLSFTGSGGAQFNNYRSSNIELVQRTAGYGIEFYTGAGSYAGKFDASGNLLVGTTSFGVAGGFGVAPGISAGAAQAIFNRTSTTSDSYPLIFQNGGSNVGFITYNNTAVAYVTSSDYRLKNITGPITTSGAYIDSLNPVEGTWKADGSTFVGLIAHEVQEASRTRVATGVKDGEEMQGMDYSSAEIIANLIAEVKSLRQRLAAAGI